MTSNTKLAKDMAEAWEQLQAAVQHLAALRKKLPPEPVDDYEFRGPGGTIRGTVAISVGCRGVSTHWGARR